MIFAALPLKQNQWRRHSQPDIALEPARQYLRYSLSCRDLAAMITERGLSLDPFLELINTFLIIPITTNGSFRTGFCWGLGLALGIGTFSRLLLYFSSPIIAFFKPTSKPAMNPGPSPFNKLMGCLKQVFILVLLIVLVVFVAYRTL